MDCVYVWCGFAPFLHALVHLYIHDRVEVKVGLRVMTNECGPSSEKVKLEPFLSV